MWSQSRINRRHILRNDSTHYLGRTVWRRHI
jgi:hypothetical protein